MKSRWLIGHFIFTVALYAGDSTIVSFSIGNVYSFGSLQQCHGFPYSTNVSYSERIVADTTLNGQRYSVFMRSQALPWRYAPEDTGVVFYRRADSTSVFQFRVSTMREDTIVNFQDTVGTFYSSGYYIFAKDSIFVFGKYYPCVQFSWAGPVYVQKFFVVHYFSPGLCEQYIDLQAARIDNVYYGDSTLVSVTVEEDGKSAFHGYALSQSYPNPFNPTTSLSFDLPERVQVKLRVYDLLGQEIAVLAEGLFAQGKHTVQWRPEGVSGGVYFVRLEAGEFRTTRKMVLLK